METVFRVQMDRGKIDFVAKDDGTFKFVPDDSLNRTAQPPEELMRVKAAIQAAKSFLQDGDVPIGGAVIVKMGEEPHVSYGRQHISGSPADLSLLIAGLGVLRAKLLMREGKTDSEKRVLHF